MINNKDYKWISGKAVESHRVLTERNNNVVNSPRPPIAITKENDPNTEIKTVELDVMNTTSHPWLSLEAIETTLKESNELIKESMKNYFIFIEYFK